MHWRCLARGSAGLPAGTRASVCVPRAHPAARHASDAAPESSTCWPVAHSVQSSPAMAPAGSQSAKYGMPLYCAAFLTEELLVLGGGGGHGIPNRCGPSGTPCASCVATNTPRGCPLPNNAGWLSSAGRTGDWSPRRCAPSPQAPSRRSGACVLYEAAALLGTTDCPLPPSAGSPCTRTGARWWLRSAPGCRYFACA